MHPTAVICVIPVVWRLRGSHVSNGNDGAKPSSSSSAVSSNPLDAPDPAVSEEDGTFGYLTTSHACQPIRCALPGPRGVARRGRERRMMLNAQASVSGRRESLKRCVSFDMVGPSVVVVRLVVVGVVYKVGKERSVCV
jgi:hypothetical protein